MSSSNSISITTTTTTSSDVLFGQTPSLHSCISLSEDLCKDLVDLCALLPVSAFRPSPDARQKKIVDRLQLIIQSLKHEQQEKEITEKFLDLLFSQWKNYEHSVGNVLKPQILTLRFAPNGYQFSDKEDVDLFLERRLIQQEKKQLAEREKRLETRTSRKRGRTESVETTTTTPQTIVIESDDYEDSDSESSDEESDDSSEDEKTNEIVVGKSKTVKTDDRKNHKKHKKL